MVSYDIDFRVKVEGVDQYISVGDCTANVTWNLGKMIRESTALEWRNEENNGLVKDVIPFIVSGLYRLETNPEEYRKYEAPNGWGTIVSCKNFFRRILLDWEKFQRDSETEGLVDVVTFWIV